MTTCPGPHHASSVPRPAADDDDITGAAARPVAVWAAAVMLVGLAGLVVLGRVGRGASWDAATVVAVVLFVATAAVLLLWRRVGWWAATSVLLLLLVVQVSAAGGDPGTGDVAACAYELVAFASRRYRSWQAASDVGSDPIGQASPAGPELLWPAEWTPEWLGGWPKRMAMATLAAFFLTIGVVLLVASRDPTSGLPLPAALVELPFALTLGAAVPLFWPRRRECPRHGRVDVGEGRALSGLVFPYSPLRTSAATVSCFAFTATGLALLLAPGLGADRSDGWLLRGVGVLATVTFGAFAVLSVRRRTRRWVIVATPQVLATVGTPTGGLVPWSAIQSIDAGETSTYIRGASVHEPHIAVTVADERQIQRDAVDSAMARLNRHFAAGDLLFAVRALAVDPRITLAALQFYLAYPDMRAELGDRRAEDRVRSGALH